MNIKKDLSSSVLLSTGASEEFCKQGIYDIAGNVWEWTLEYSSYTSYPSTLRGGNSENYGNDSASDRNCSDTVSYNYDAGFRIALY